MTDAERREYRQALDNLNRLIAWLETNGLGRNVAVTSTLAEQENHIVELYDRIAELTLRLNAVEAQRAQ